ncbi:MAG: DUF5615 family PIN-like protein [Acidobacteria bacterium]|nr:DUF5615 family PIN-like protein [Acidobacteriota bacterium]
MSFQFYMDVHIPWSITKGLRLRGIDVLTSQEDGTREFEDAALLDCATELERVLFTQDDDFLREATLRFQTGAIFSGIVYAHQDTAMVGQYLDDLELIAQVCEPDEWINRLEYLPLK